MNLRIIQGEIALPGDFRFDITTNHPFFSNDGATSTPSTLPATPTNRRALGNPENLNAAKRFNRHLPAVLSHGVFFKKCRLVIDSASKTGGITASLALEESELYAEHQDKQLKEIITQTTEEYSGSLSSFLNARYTSKNYDWVFLKVAADAEDTSTADSTGSTRRASVVLNETTTAAGTTLKTSGFTIRRSNGQGGQSLIQLQDYYGLAPFLKLHALIRITFENLGYTVAENVFATDPELSQIVLLHQTADAMVDISTSANAGTVQIHYEDMVPSISVGELIEWLHDKFGAFVSVRNDEIKIRLLRNILTDAYDMDLSGYIRDEIAIRHLDPVMLRIGCQHDIEGSEVAAETLENLRAAYPSLVSCFQVAEAEGLGLFHVLPLGKYYFRNSVADGLIKVGTDGFDCYREMGVESKEYITDDSLVPMIYHNSEYLPYIGETIRRHIDIDDKAADAEQKILICYCKNNGIRNFGTLYNYNPTGAALSTTTTDLIPEGITERYWEKYRRLLLDGAVTVSVKLDIPLHVLVSMDICTPKLLNGAVVIIQSLKYSLSESGITSCEASMMRIQEAVDGEEIKDPIFGSNLVWKLVSTRTIFTYGKVTGNHKNGVLVKETDGLSDYTPADAPSYTPKYPGIREKVRKRWLKYTVYKYESGGWFLWHWSSSSSYDATEEYEEYFISQNQ